MNKHTNTKMMNTQTTSNRGFAMKTLMRAGALSLAAAVAAACSLIPATDINRVQPNYVSKDLFRGEWYARALVVDKQYTISFPFTGFEGSLERVRWEITEGAVQAFRSYEKVPGEESDGIGEQTLVAEFPIESHFDIRRAYNASNGLESNVIEENTTDRPWWERDYIRVDWSTNSAMRDTPFDLEGFVNTLTQTSISRNVTEAHPTERFKVRVSNDYIETTVDALMMPDFYTCVGLGPDWFNCQGTEVRTKYSFMRRDSSHDMYEPQHYPDRVPAQYGYKENIFGDLSFCFADEPMTVRLVADPGSDPAGSPATQAALPATYRVTLEGFDFETVVSPDSGMTVKALCDDLTGKIDASNVPVQVVRRGPPEDANNPNSAVLCNEFSIEANQAYVTPGREYSMSIVAIDLDGNDLANGQGISVSEPCELRDLYSIYGPFGQELCDPNVHDVDDCFQDTQDVFTRFGFFRTERILYDRENGETLTGRDQLINRWNIWERSRYADGNPIPYEDRTPKPVVYHLNAGFPASLIEATQQQADDWNDAFLDTIAELQQKTVEEVEADYGTDGNPFVAYQIVENSCNAANIGTYIEANADYRDLNMDLMMHGMDAADLGPGNIETACAVLEHYSKLAGVPEPFHWEQLGDLRYSFINWIATPEPGGPLGYGPSAADPVTGEIVSANANIYGASLDTYANWGGDIVQWLNGELEIGDIINGTHIREYVEQVRARVRAPVDRQVGRDMAALFDERTAGLTEAEYLPRIPIASLNSNLDKLQESGFEREHLLTDEQIRLFGGLRADPNGDFSDGQVERALASNWGRTSVPPALRDNKNLYQMLDSDPNATQNLFEMYRDRQDAFGRLNFCYFMEEMEPAVADLAFELRGKTREQAVQTIRHNIMRGVLAHEVGHTVGLRHNFEGSSDPLNFFPGWWGVETGNHLDSDNERKEELAYSSIMDYHQRFNGDFGGIGLYDKAAIKFGYGNLVEVFDEREESFIPRDWAQSLWLFYPDDLPYLLAGGDANDVVQAKYSEIIDELNYNGNNQVFMDVKDLGITPKPENLFKRTNVTFNEWRRQDVRRYFGLGNEDGSSILIEVPYSYCSDGFAWGGSLSCNRFDKGATSEEIVKNAIEMYEFYYPFYTYMGARAENPVSPWYNGWVTRLRDRFLQPLRNAFTYFYYYRRSTAQIWPLFLDWSIASHQGLNQLVSIIQRPEPGTYCLENSMYVPQADMPEGAACTQPVDLALGQARQYRSTFTDEYDFRFRNVGHMWDKIMALNMLTSTDAFFYRDFSNQVDRSAFSISYYRVFQDEMLQLLGGMVMDERSAFAPQIDPVTQEIIYNPLVSFRGQMPTPAAGPMIKPSSNYTLENYALFWGMAGFSSTLDQTLDFAQRSKISIIGESNDPVLTGNEAIFTDPKSGVQFHAYDTDGSELSLGFKLVNDAQDYVATTWQPAKTALDLADAAKANNDDPAYRAALQEYNRVDRVLNDKIHTIDLTRFLTKALEASN